MSYGFDEVRDSRDVVKIPFIWVTLALSLLLHIAALWQWLPQMKFLSNEKTEKNEGGDRLQVRLAPQPSPPSAPPPSPAQQAAAAAQPVQPQASIQPRPPKSAVPQQSTRPVIALNQPAPDRQPAPPSVPAVAPPAPPSAVGDLAALIEARRLARGNSAPSEASEPIESENERSTRIIAGNLAPRQAPTFGYDPKSGGGVFQLQRVGLNDAEFLFFGWNKDIRRNSVQTVEVRKGNNSDIRIAVVRRMIALIRENERGDFTWESRRLGRVISLSARPADNSGLEDFLMQEFFSNPRPR